MKLKTDLNVDPLSFANGNGVFELAYDAASAHALLQSLNEHVGEHTNLSLCIIRRAGDILAEWGYREE